MYLQKILCSQQIISFGIENARKGLSGEYMKINNTNDYLKYRTIILSNDYSEISKQLDRNKLLMNEINNKISEIKSTVDEAFGMFSPIAAEENNFNKQEVKELQMRLYLLAEENKELKAKIKNINEELNVINQLVSNTNVEKEENNILDNEMIEKLTMCLKIVENDPRRVKNEITNILEMIKK